MSLDASAAAKLVSALDAELLRRQAKRDEAQDAAWAEQFAGDELIELMIFVKQLERQWDRTKPGASLAPLDDAVIAELEDRAISFYSMAETLEGLEQAREDEAAGIRRRPKVTHVRSVAKLLPTAPRPDPAAPKPAERVGRRNGAAPALAMPGTPEADARWVHGVVTTWNPRTHEGMIRAADGSEYRLADGVLMRSGLVSLIPQMKGEFKIVAGEVDTVKAAWH
jgi:hypothetical protein